MSFSIKNSDPVKIIGSLPIPINHDSIKLVVGCAGNITGIYSSYAVSTDGINFTRIFIGATSLGAYIRGFFYSSQQNKLGAAGSGGPGSSLDYRFGSSSDARNWIASNSTSATDISFNRGYAIGYDPSNNRWIGGGTSTVPASRPGIAYSTDAINWTQLPLADCSMGFCDSVYYSSQQGRWVAVGSTSGSSNSQIMAYSNNGLNWITIPNILGGGRGSTEEGDVFYSSQQNRWVAVGIPFTGGNNAIAWSNDGISWTGLGVNDLSNGFGVAYSPTVNRWVAVGGGANSIVYSNDGITWTAVPNSLTIISNVSDVTYSSLLDRFYVVTFTGNMAYSSDGINWTSLPNTQNGLAGVTNVFTIYGLPVGLGALPLEYWQYEQSKQFNKIAY